MSLDELDALIAAVADPAAILVSEPDWHALFSEACHGREVIEGGRVLWRGLPVWIRWPGQTRVLSSAEAAREGLRDL